MNYKCFATKEIHCLPIFITSFAGKAKGENENGEQMVQQKNSMFPHAWVTNGEIEELYTIGSMKNNFYI